MEGLSGALPPLATENLLRLIGGLTFLLFVEIWFGRSIPSSDGFIICDDLRIIIIVIIIMKCIFLEINIVLVKGGKLPRKETERLKIERT